MHIRFKPKIIHSNKTKQYITGCIALSWLCTFMFLHKEFERLKISMHSWFPHFRSESSMSSNTSRDGIKVFQIEDFATYGVLGSCSISKTSLLQ